MSLQKNAAQAMQYELEATKQSTNGRGIAVKAYKQAVRRNNSFYTLWLLAVKHKTGLLATGNIILVMNWALPEWPAMVLGLFGK